MMERRAYLNQLVSWKDQDIIKLVSGVRHCGKTTILKIYLITHNQQVDPIIEIIFTHKSQEN